MSSTIGKIRAKLEIWNKFPHFLVFLALSTVLFYSSLRALSSRKFLHLAFLHCVFSTGGSSFPLHCCSPPSLHISHLQGKFSPGSNPHYVTDPSVSQICAMHWELGYNIGALEIGI